MIMHQLNEQQAAQLTGVEFVPGNKFNPLPYDGKYVISPEEVAQCSIAWVKELPEVEYVPPIPEDLE